jgi:hypothetical protein
MKSSRLLSEASMLKKEISDVLRQTLFFILITFLLPAFLVLTKIYPDRSYLNAFFPVFQFGLFFWAFFMGASLFSVERGQNGMEYLLSLPLSRYKLIGLKILPRFISVLIFYGIFLIFFFGPGSNASALSLICFSFIYFSLYLISLSFSASSENFLVLFVISCLFLFLFLGLEYSLFWLTVKTKGYVYFTPHITPFITGDLEPFTVSFLIITGLFLLTPFLAAFIFSIKRFDIKPPLVYNRRFVKILAPLFIVGLVASFFLSYQIIHFGYNDYYLTRNNTLIERNIYFGFKIYDGKNVHKIKGFYPSFLPFAEEGPSVYGWAYDSIIRVNTSDFKVEQLYKSPEGRRFIETRKSGQTIAFLEYKGIKFLEGTERQLVLLDITSKKISRISLDFEPLQKGGISLMGAGTLEGRDFWLLSTWSHGKDRQVFRLWRDGEVRFVKETRYIPLYISPHLFTYSEKDIIISEDREGRFETLRKIPNEKRYRLIGIGYFPWFWSEDKNNLLIKEIYGWVPPSKEEPGEDTLCARLDLETFEIEELPKVKGWPYCFCTDECYFEEKNIQDGTLSFYRLDDNQIKLIRKFNISFKKTFYPYKIFPSGIVFGQGKKARVYAFPDLKKIKFKHL